VGDERLPSGGVVRLASQTPDGTPVVLAAKAGHNGVPHNHDDVGTFMLHAAGETFLCDPERGLYDLYNRFGHAANVFANSYGHSVPRIGDTLQSRGAAFGGDVVSCQTDGPDKQVEMSLAGAYEVDGLEAVDRTFVLDREGTLTVEDRVSLTGDPLPVQEAFVTWLRCLVSGNTALLIGERHVLELTIESPAEVTFALEVLEKESADNHKKVPLKRLSFTVPAAQEIAPREIAARQMVARVRARLLPSQVSAQTGRARATDE